ncbi:hypothetical protein PUMCH_000654 [Australozyma saopauloensis]|uniref:DUF7702 domain-containing protein n=1 Tax=Australozyma saopauloensis TaxID=291208 RepID=A0AAX4H506_9ASCO|nr:hypothetical protein PUMCH_000654 [[Candida] saopauloensis]
MTSFKLKSTGIAASVFLAVYAIYFGFATWVVWKKGFRTMFTALWVFAILRVAGQACGVAYASLGLSHYQLLIAYMVLGAQGFLALIYASLRAVMHEQRLKYGKSWFDTYPILGRLGPVLKRFHIYFFQTCFSVTHCILAAGSIVFIVGGAEMAGIDVTNPSTYSDYRTSRNLRIAGALLYLVGMIILVALAIRAYTHEKVKTLSMKYILLAVPFFLIHIVYNFLAIFVSRMDLFRISNYGFGGGNSSLVVSESIMSTAMDVFICVFLTAAFLNTVHDAKHLQSQPYETTSEKTSV